MSMPEIPRLSADEFIEKIQAASSYGLVMNPLRNEMELIIREENGEVQGYLGPDPDKTKASKLSKFLKRLEAIVKQDSDDDKAS